MNSGFNSKSKKYYFFIITCLYLGGVAVYWAARGSLWCPYDMSVLDYFYKHALKTFAGPQPSFDPGIVYLTITDDTYRYLGNNFLDRKDLARLNQALSRLKPVSVAYDIIFAMPGPAESDRLFAQSIESLGSVFLPVGCSLSAQKDLNCHEPDGKGAFSNGLIRPVQKNDGSPFCSTRVLETRDAFLQISRGTGNIGVRADPDGVYRHVPILTRVGDAFMPTLSLSVFMAWARVQAADLTVNWGSNITLSMNDGKRRDLVIPVDIHGQAFVPYVAPMGNDFPMISAHRFLEAYKDDGLRGNLMDLIEGNFVIIADTSTGAADLGATAIDRLSPLVTLHASLLNGMLTQTFYTPWPSMRVMYVIAFMAAFMALSALARFSAMIYITGTACLVTSLALTWFEFTHFRLFPFATIALSGTGLFVALVSALEYVAKREQSFVKNVFSRYVPQSVVNELLADPGNLNLGGEERTATVLFSDIADFTSISERLPPKDLVSLVNNYLTEMTDVILEQGGIIDKFQGDAIMAEFGVPLACNDHADKAVRAGLEMQRRLCRLRSKWQGDGLPELYCRIGINTGKMIVGNMGSDTVLDYTVMGDAVNLASRLEGANKFYGTGLMVSQFTLDALVSQDYRSRLLDIIRVKGKSDAVRVYEITGYRNDVVTQDSATYYSYYQKGYTAYLNREFTGARQYFENALSFKPGDVAAIAMIERVNLLINDDPGPDWDGSVRLTAK